MHSTPPNTSKTRWWDPLAALLIYCTLITAASRLVVTQWTEDLFTIHTLTFLGVSLGLALGISKFSGKVSSLLALAYGFFMVIWQLALPMPNYILWKDRMLILIQRLTETVNLALASKPVNDNILFLLLISTLFWGIGVYAGFNITRHASAWRAVLPAGMALIVIQSYDPLVARRAWFLAAFLLFALLLIARITFVRNRLEWKENRTYVPPDIGFDWIRFTLVTAVLLIVFAWTMPALAESMPAARQAWHNIREPWDRFTDRMSNMFNSLQSSAGPFVENYGSSMALSRGSTLTDTPVMVVDVPPRPFAGVRYYWRAYAYDHYEDGQWLSSIDETEYIDPDSAGIPLIESEGRRIATFSFTPQVPIMTLYTAPQPFWVSVPSRAFIENQPDGMIDLAALQALNPVAAGDTYEVRSSVSAVTIRQLQEAGTEYPEWILDRYLQLPDDITPRTIELAQQIAEEKDNAYDVTVAITEYLRKFEYQETIDAPPADQEIIDWWLFDYQIGFCQYYATAEVLMLRALGIPARMAVGYAQGEFLGRGADTGLADEQFTDPEDFIDRGGMYIVRNRDAHTWPEVYFPGTGWVEFEPTASQSTITRPRGDNSSGSDLDREDFRDFDEPQMLDEDLDELPERDFAGGIVPDSNTPWWPYLLAATPIAIVIYFFTRWRRKPNVDLTPIPVRLERVLKKFGLKPPALLRKWSERANVSPLIKSYMEINRALRRLGSPPAINDTPAERAAALATLLPASESLVRRLVTEYHISMYSLKNADIQAARAAGTEIRWLSFKAFITALITGQEEAYAKVRR
jgi:transglutaminase-like putative cysteine protease